MQNSSQWCLQNVQLLRTTTQTFCHSSNVLGCKHCFLVYRWEWQFLSLFSQNNEHTELAVLLFFQNLYVVFAHFLQHYHDFQIKVAIFPSVVQAYTQPYSFSGRVTLIICEIRHELSVIIHEISTSWKKALYGGRNSMVLIDLEYFCRSWSRIAPRQVGLSEGYC